MPMTKTNIERVAEFMEYGSALRQPFVIEAIMRYADLVAAANPDHWEDGFISVQAWQQVARDAQEAFAVYSNTTPEKQS